MELLQTSQDVLNIVKAISIAFVSVFFCWFMFYGIMILRQAFQVIRDVSEGISKAKEAVNSLKEKIDNSSVYLSLIGEGVKKLVDIAKDYSGKKKKGK